MKKLNRYLSVHNHVWINRFKLIFITGTIICLPIFLIVLNGQVALKFKHLTREDGLSQASVFAITQDSEGFLWFGTRDGLNKYDGLGFKIYKQDNSINSLISNDVRTIFMDSLYSQMWIGTLSGLSLFDIKTEKFISEFDFGKDTFPISNLVVRDIFRDSKSRLWLATSNGLFKYDDTKKYFKLIPLQGIETKGEIKIDVTKIIEKTDNKLWISTSHGLFFDATDQGEKLQYSALNTKLPKDNYTYLLDDGQGYLWIGTANIGVIQWNIKDETFVHFQAGTSTNYRISNNNIRTICQDATKRIWIGTFQGLNEYDRVNNSFFEHQKQVGNTYALSDNSIKSLYSDDKGNLWIGTYYGGVNYLDKAYNQFVNYSFSSKNNGLSAGVISSFAEDWKGNLWVGTEGGGLNYLDSKSQKFQVFSKDEKAKNLVGNNIKSLFLDNENLWIGTFTNGMSKLNVKTREIQNFKYDPQNSNSITNNNVYSFCKKGDKLWIATYGGGINVMNTVSNSFRQFRHDPSGPKSLSSDLTRVFLTTTSGELWIGTEKGVNRIFVDSEGYPSSFEVILKTEKIYALQEDKKRNIWIGTISNGLFIYEYQSKEIIHLTTKDGLAGNTVFGILEDEKNLMWISTNNGLSKLNADNHSFTNYNQSNGLNDIEFNFNAYYKTEQKELLFGGINGFIRFNPEQIITNTFIPRIAFTNLKQNNIPVAISAKNSPLSESINQTKNLVFEYNQANFTLEFAALDFSTPDLNHFSYKLEGLDNDWNNTIGKSEATYTIQREGKYLFRLRVGNSDGIWNPEERTILIEVKPPLYRTIWAYLLYLIAISLAIFALYRYLKLRNSLVLQKLEKEQQEELHEVKLRFFTNITHEFRTPLTLIMGPLRELLNNEQINDDKKQKLSMIERNAQRLLNLVNQILTFRKLATDHEPIHPKQTEIVHFSHEIYLLFAESARLKNIEFNFRHSKDEIYVWVDQDKIEKVLFNLLSNAFKFTPSKGKISFEIDQNKKYTIISINDNGAGISEELHDQVFKRFYEKSYPQNSSIKGSGIGLAISKQLIELHHGHIELESSEGQGAYFKVFIPNGKEHFNSNVFQENYKENIVQETLNQQLVMEFQPLKVQEKSKNEKENSQQELLLIIEDNEEVNDYIQHIFYNDFKIITAKNGIEGLKKVKKYMPSLIISDVMMPEMDGIEMCKTLKTDLEICHIPVILLTARTASIFKIEGLKIGADDYITKPFNPEELKLRVRNIIKSRKESRKKFAKVMTFDPKLIEITSIDEDFLNRAMEIVETNIQNSDFNTEQFASDLAVSRALLFTKIRALTEQTPNNFIKSIRLKQASQLIKQEKLTISEVAYKVGFNDPKYFRKCFYAQYGVNPVDYNSTIKEEKEN